MLALSAITVSVALVCMIVAMLRWLVRVAKSLSTLDQPADRPTVGGGLRKWWAMAPRLNPDLVLFLVVVALFALVVLGLVAYFRWAE
jgi:hypothetical protein